MKKTVPAFLAGVVVALLLCSFTAAANSIPNSGADIHIWPINVMVNGEIFQPKDVNGNDVLVFSYNGTTYAPLRALAEAYGLVVGYDETTYTATVVSPEWQEEQDRKEALSKEYASWSAEKEADYQTFKGMWDPIIYNKENPTVVIFGYGMYYNGETIDPLTKLLDKYSDGEVRNFSKRLLDEVQTANADYRMGTATYRMGNVIFWTDDYQYDDFYYKRQYLDVDITQTQQ